MKTQLSRRTLMKGIGASAVGLAAGSLLGLDPSIVAAQSAVTRPAASAFYRFTLGKFEIMVIQDGTTPFEAATFAVNALAGDADKLLKDNNLPQKYVNLSVNVVLVKSGDQTILLDSGANQWEPAPGAPLLGGRLFATLDAAGIKADSITGIVLSHFHPDHLGGISDGKVPLFPKATIYMPEGDQKFLDTAPAGTPIDGFIKVAKEKLGGVKERVKLYKPDTELLPGFTAVASPGHTPGHTAILLNSDGNQLLYTADTVAHSVIALAHPEWHSGVDQDGDTAEKSRRMILGQVSAKGTQILAYHFQFPGIGYVDTDGEGYRFVAAI